MISFGNNQNILDSFLLRKQCSPEVLQGDTHSEQAVWCDTSDNPMEKTLMSKLINF
jgi:hypothetical protein